MAAAEELPRLAELGVTVVEVMPVAEFPGRFGWGYDGVGLFAPFHGYGAPADFRRFVDAAHRAGLGVILDVVYNHLGPDGNHLGAFTPAYFSSTHTTDWGQAFDFDGPASAGVRELFVSNARHWTREYHLDGFRFDATQDIHDAGPEHILAELARAARAEAGARGVLLVAESEPQEVRLVLPREQGGHGLDLVGNEDFHHAALVALTGRREGYYENHLGGAQEILSAVKHGFLYQGQWYAWQGQRRGTPTRGLDRGHLLHFLENHDQVANSARGERLHRLTSPGRWRAFTALQLLSPQTPLLFQGQEFASSAPFLFFADHGPELALAVREGRRRFLSQFRDLADPETVARFADPGDPATFERCKLDPAERERNEAAVALHADLLALRREDPAFSRAIPCELDGAVLGERAFLLRWTAPEGERGSDRLLLVSWGTDLRLLPAPEPLLAPPPGFRWELLWSSESPRYGGRGTPPVETEAWNLAGEAAVVMAPRP
jgi:maltooligosyltrehalose trehalohydrolase